MLRTGLLRGHAITLHGTPPAFADRLRTLGATVHPAAAPPPESVNVGSATSLVAEPTLSMGGGGGVDALVVDARGAFAAAGGGYDGLRAAVDGTFAAVRDHAIAHWIDADRGGHVVMIAPAVGAGLHAGAARAGLENLARSLGTEWARHAVRTVALLPGEATPDDALAELVAWLLSPAGAYITGTALTLDAG